MKRTVEFYTQVLGMRLIKTINLPGGQGQHFFFDMGGGNALAFFWFPDAPEPVPGVSTPVTVPGLGEWTSAVGSMNHVAFNVPEERFGDYRAKLKAKGVRVSPVIDHDDSEFGVARELHPGVFVRSFYFQDPGRHPARVRLLAPRHGPARRRQARTQDRRRPHWRPGLAGAVPGPRGHHGRRERVPSRGGSGAGGAPGGRRRRRHRRPPDDRWGETVHAVAVPAAENGVPAFGAATLVSWAGERLAGLKYPTGVTVVAELPRNYWRPEAR